MWGDLGAQPSREIALPLGPHISTVEIARNPADKHVWKQWKLPLPPRP